MQFNGDVVNGKPHGAGFHVLLATDGRVGVMYFRDGKALRASWSVHSRESLILIGSMGSRRVPVARSAYRFGLSHKLGLLFHCGVDLTFRRKIYEGEFSNSLMHGRGTSYWNSGSGSSRNQTLTRSGAEK